MSAPSTEPITKDRSVNCGTVSPRYTSRNHLSSTSVAPLAVAPSTAPFAAAAEAVSSFAPWVMGAMLGRNARQ